jgi:hypothetical protein
MFQGRLLEVEVGFNKAGFDGASEKPVWIWNFTVCIFWDDFNGYLLWWRQWDLWWREWDLNLNNVDDETYFYMNYIIYYTFYRMNEGNENDDVYVIFLYIYHHLYLYLYTYLFLFCLYLFYPNLSLFLCRLLLWRFIGLLWMVMKKKQKKHSVG